MDDNTRKAGDEMIAESSLQAYLNDICRTPLLSADRERELARRLIRDDDTAARDELVLSNLRLVVSIAKKYANRGLPLQDLIAEGNIGLLKAADGFNPELNLRFSSYAVWWIKKRIKQASITSIQPVRVPAYLMKVIANWKQAVSVMENSLGRSPNFDELANQMKISARKLRIFQDAMRAFHSYAQAQVNEDDGLAPHERLGDERTLTPDEIVLEKDQVRTIYGLLNKIDQREAEILRWRFGLEDREALTLTAVGEKLGLTRERVRQIESDALQKLNGYLSADRLPLLDQEAAEGQAIGTVAEWETPVWAMEDEDLAVPA